MYWSLIQALENGIGIHHGKFPKYVQNEVLRLFNDNEIVDYTKKREYYEIISDAIEYHNKYDFPSSISDRSKLFCNLVRDKKSFYQNKYYKA